MPLLCTALAAAACSQDTPLQSFLSGDAQRREALLASLWFRDNDYARLRLAHYANSSDSGDWDALPQWWPASVPLRSGQEAAAPHSQDLPQLPTDSAAALETALLQLGEAAFFDYPAQLVDGFELVLGSPALLDAYGLWRGLAPADSADAAPRLGGLIRVGLPSGGTALALSCASCHAHAPSARVEPGWPAAHLDIGALVQDQAPPGVELPAAHWGPGRVDVSPDGADNPVAIPDLRVVTYQRYLHHEATLRNDVADPSQPAPPPLALAVRIETLLITTFEEQARPPPAVALGLALYLRSLAPAESVPASGRGQDLFAALCQSCHASADYAGEPVALSVIGTDPAAALSRERGTGAYRVPTLRVVATRSALMHDGRLPDPGALLDPARLSADYTGALHGPGPVAGHPYGLDLPSADREALLAFLRTL